MILIYLPRPINSHNTIMRKGRLAVFFLGSMFPKTLKMHSQVKSLLTEPLYLLTLLLFDIFISNNTHRLLVVSTTSTRAVKIRPKWGINRPNFERCVHVERPIFWKYVKKNWNIYTNHRPVIWEKLSEVGSPSQPSQLYRASVQQKNVAPFDRVNGWPSQSWIHTDFNIPSSIQ